MWLVGMIVVGMEFKLLREMESRLGRTNRPPQLKPPRPVKFG